MKRVITLIDGTWNEEGIGNDTNIAKIEPSVRGLSKSTEARAPARRTAGNQCPAPIALTTSLRRSIATGSRSML